MIEKKLLFSTKDFPVQAGFIEDCLSGDYDVIMYGGAIKGGKTGGSLISLELLHKAYPGSRSAIVRKTSKILETNTLPAWDKFKVKKWIEFDNKSRVEFKNGSHIDFFGENIDRDPELNRWKGLDVNFFLLEEANELDEVTFEKALERVGSWIIPGIDEKDQPPPLIILTCNPAQNWVKKKFYDAWKSGTLPPRWKYIPAKITDNPYYTNNVRFMEKLKSLPPFFYQVYVLGKWDVALKEGGEFYKYFEIDETVVKGLKYDPDLALHFSADFNVNPGINGFVAQVEKIDPPEGSEDLEPSYNVYIIDELVLESETKRNSTPELGKEFATRYKKHKGKKVFYYGDPAGLARDTRTGKGINDFSLLARELKDFDAERRVDTKAPSVVGRGTWINEIFRVPEERKIRIYISVDCQNMINDLIKVKESPDGTKHKKKVKNPKTGISYEPYGHLSDALDYFLCKAFKEDFNLFTRGINDLEIRGGEYTPAKSSRSETYSGRRGRR